jgi:hypothetical protein
MLLCAVLVCKSGAILPAAQKARKYAGFSFSFSQKREGLAGREEKNAALVVIFAGLRLPRCAAGLYFPHG